jgi:hypothetical protein
MTPVALFVALLAGLYVWSKSRPTATVKTASGTMTGVVVQSKGKKKIPASSFSGTVGPTCQGTVPGANVSPSVENQKAPTVTGYPGVVKEAAILSVCKPGLVVSVPTDRFTTRVTATVSPVCSCLLECGASYYAAEAAVHAQTVAAGVNACSGWPEWVSGIGLNPTASGWVYQDGSVFFETGTQQGRATGIPGAPNYWGGQTSIAAVSNNVAVSPLAMSKVISKK